MQTTHQTTHNDFAKTLTGLMKPAVTAPTFGDVCHQIERGNHALISLEVLAGILCEMDIDTAMYRLDRVIEREVSKAKVGHWSYNACRHTALLEHRQKLLNFIEGQTFLEAAE